MNAAMCTDVVCMLSPELQAMVRTGGKVGARAFQECVARGMVAVYARAYTHDVVVARAFGDSDVEEEEDVWSSGTPALEFIPISCISTRRSTTPVRNIVVTFPLLSREEHRSLQEGHYLTKAPCGTIILHACFSSHFIDHVTRGNRQNIIAEVYDCETIHDSFLAFRQNLEVFSLRATKTRNRDTVCRTDDETVHPKTNSMFDGELGETVLGVLSEFIGELSPTSIRSSSIQFRHPTQRPTIRNPPRTLTSIRNGFLQFSNLCRGIDLSGLGNVTTVGDGFMRGVTGITSINLSALTSLVFIGADCLTKCPQLKTVDASGLCNVQYVGFYLLSYCPKLENVDLRAMGALTTLGSMVVDCPSLDSVHFPVGTPLTFRRDKIHGGFHTSESFVRDGRYVPALSTQWLKSREAAHTAATGGMWTSANEGDVMGVD